MTGYKTSINNNKYIHNTIKLDSNAKRHSLKIWMNQQF